jgi:hypothetical protein
MSRSILAITPSAFLAQFLERCFSGHTDVEFHSAATVETGLKEAVMLRPDTVILDAFVAGQGLPQVCAAFAKRLSSPLVVLHAPDTEATDLLPAARVVCQGKLEVIDKPFTLTGITQKVLGALPVSPAKPKASDPYAWLGSEPEVLGHVQMLSNGSVGSSSGCGDMELATAMRSAMRLAAHLGNELGLEELTAAKFFGVVTRSVVYPTPAGTFSIVTTPKTSVESLVQRIEAAT